MRETVEDHYHLFVFAESKNASVTEDELVDNFR